MLEIIKKQFQKKSALSHNKSHSMINKGFYPKYYWDMYPLAQDYYHELNPFFLFNMYRKEFIDYYKVVTVRDGYLTFADFMVNNISYLSKLKSQVFIIHPDLAPIVPSNLIHHFACWERVQKKQISLEEARKVIIFGFACEQYLGEMNKIPERLDILEDIHPEASIEIYLPLRKNIFKKEEKESLLIHQFMNHLKDKIPGREIKILASEHFFDLTNFKNTYFLDLAWDQFIVSDNYLHYYVQSRGGTVNNFSSSTASADSMFCLDLSIYHEFHVVPLEKKESIFAELLLYKKMSPNPRELSFDVQFQNLLREGLKKNL